MSNFIVQALRGEPLSVYGDGSQTRSFCYVEDMIEGLMAVLCHPSDRSVERRTDRAFLYRNGDNEDSIHHPINLGNPEERTVLDIAQIVLQATGSTSPLRFLPLPVDDPHVRRPDTSRASRLLGWTPRVSIEEGISRTVDYFRTAVSPDISPAIARPGERAAGVLEPSRAIVMP